MKSEQSNKLIKLDRILNIAIIVTVIPAVAWYFSGSQDVVGAESLTCFRYFTTDSNILMAVVSAVWLWQLSKKRKNPSYEFPKWLTALRLAGTTSVTLTFLMCVFFLAPMAWMRRGIAGALHFFTGNVFILHFLSPVMAITSFGLAADGKQAKRLDCLWAILPMFIYSIVYLIMVVLLGKWYDFYGFTFGGQYRIVPIVVAVIYLATFGMASALKAIRNRSLSKASEGNL